MRTLRQDLTYSARILLKRPALTFVTVLTLALAIGANSAIFSVVNAILLRPLPFRDQDRMVVLWHSYPQLNLQKSPISPPGFVTYTYKEQSQSFNAVAAMAYRGLNLTGQDEPEQIQGMFVSADFFPALGVQPLIGRTFTPEEDQPGRNRVVILGQNFWQRRFGSDRSIINKPITLNGIDFTVVGVMPSDFQLFNKADFWSPIALAPAQVGRPSSATSTSRSSRG
jgi:putative ABC transport system permease protein